MKQYITQFAIDFIHAVFLAALIGGPFFYYFMFMMKP